MASNYFKMNQLPIELWHLILRPYFTIQEILKLKYVCLDWYNIIKNEFKFNELIFRLKDSNYDDSNSWYYTYEPIDLRNVIFCNRIDYRDYSSSINFYPLDVFGIESFMNTFSNLKRLKIRLKPRFDLEIFNQFSNTLEQLEIENNQRELKLIKNTILNLPELKIFKIEFDLETHRRVILNLELTIQSNKLEILKCLSLKKINIINSNTIKYIDLESNFMENFQIFTNLEILKFKNPYSNIDDYLLDSIPSNLKELHVYFNYNCVSQFSKIIPLFIDRKLKRPETNQLKIYLQGVQLMNNKRSPFDYSFKDGLAFEESLQIFCKNYDNLENKIDWFTSINSYHSLINKFNNKIPNNFNQKFLNIQKLCVTKRIDNKQQFYYLLNELKNLIELKLNNTSLDTDFYSSLPLITPRLIELKIIENIELNIDYKFLNKLILLKSFNTNHYLSFNLIKELLINLPLINNLFSKNNFKSIMIIKNEFGTYSFQYLQNHWDHLKLNELINLCNLDHDS